MWIKRRRDKRTKILGESRKGGGGEKKVNAWSKCQIPWKKGGGRVKVHGSWKEVTRKNKNGERRLSCCWSFSIQETQNGFPRTL